MDLKSQIKKLAFECKIIKNSDFSRPNGLSRQYIARIIKEMVSAGDLVKGGSTRKAVYSLPENAIYLNPKFSLKLKNINLEEDRILNEVRLSLPGYNKISNEVKGSFDYSLSEILNNAIEHSCSKTIDINIGINNNELEFSIKDEGVGVFENIMC